MITAYHLLIFRFNSSFTSLTRTRSAGSVVFRCSIASLFESDFRQASQICPLLNVSWFSQPLAIVYWHIKLSGVGNSNLYLVSFIESISKVPILSSLSSNDLFNPNLVVFQISKIEVIKNHTPCLELGMPLRFSYEKPSVSCFDHLILKIYIYRNPRLRLFNKLSSLFSNLSGL